VFLWLENLLKILVIFVLSRQGISPPIFLGAPLNGANSRGSDGAQDILTPGSKITPYHIQ
jgi:hypothetical protein